MSDVFTDQLKSLHTAAIDAKNDYMEALDDAAGHGMTVLFNGLGKSVLPGLIDGEERNASHYGDALNAPGVPDDVRMILIAERAHIDNAIAKMRVAEK